MLSELCSAGVNSQDEGLLSELCSAGVNSQDEGLLSELCSAGVNTSFPPEFILDCDRVNRERESQSRELGERSGSRVVSKEYNF